MTTTLQEWLDTTGQRYIDMGYRKHAGHYKNEDFGYWKTIYDDEEKVYQIGILVYDFSKHQHIPEEQKRIGVQYECLLLETDTRIDLSVSDNKIEIERFEIMARAFYETMKEYAPSW
jgi:hypothetical protein